jgi:hypothetical protein
LMNYYCPTSLQEIFWFLCIWDLHSFCFIP